MLRISQRGGQDELYVASELVSWSQWHGPVSQSSELTLESAESLTSGNGDFLTGDLGGCIIVSI